MEHYDYMLIFGGFFVSVILPIVLSVSLSDDKPNAPIKRRGGRSQAKHQKAQPASA